MKDQFQITLINYKLKLYQRFSWFLIIVFYTLIGYYYFFATKNNNTSTGIIFLSVTIALSISKIVLEKTKYKIELRYFFGIAVLFLLINQQYVFAILALILLFFYTASTWPKILTANDNGILYPSFPIKKIKWNELNAALLKDGLLTIDFKTDKIIQQYIDESKTNVREQDFNEFCNKQISK